MSKKIIITYTGDIEDAMEKVYKVIREGQVSEAAGIKHYCWVTTFRDGEAVIVKRKRTKKSADSFIVRK